MSQVDLDAAKKEARRRIHNLVEDYMRVLAAGKKESFNEERVKIAFIVPMLDALGWNPRTDQVLPEQATLTGRADFGLRVGGRTKVFVEMKRFSKSLDGHYIVKGKPRSFAEQAIQYAWGMKASWAILTNFEETRLYDSHVKKPEDGLVWKQSIRFTEYESRFDELWLISRQSVVSGALDAYRAKIERPPVDKAFLEDLMTCRQLLAEDIKNNNPDLTYDQINESVQKILDRLIFIKNCEDRLIIPAESLWKRFKAWQETAIDKEIVIFMMDLKNLFRYFDQVYNGKLFEKHPCEDLKISNDVFEKIIDTLYGDGQHLGYNFSVIPVDVLGQVYELYIGSIIKEKEGAAQAIEIIKKPAKRKALGIYYTPEPVVDYIIRSTLGKVLKRCKSPEDVSRIKVLDPACGSGSFLIKAFDVIREWYENYNKRNQPISVPGTLDAHILPVPNIEERILTENLYGVDLDPQAVEITILNLSLKAIKTKEKLPYMADHIKCGNSLIDDEAITEKNFKWNEEFEEIMKGGFDVVIGNPPYVRHEELLPIKPYLQSRYEVFHSRADLFVYFFERELKILKENGYFGMIVSNKWLKTGYGRNLRKFLSDFWIEQFVDFGDLRIFQDAISYPCIIIMRKIEKQNPKIRSCQVKTVRFVNLEDYIKQNQFMVDQNSLDISGWNFSSRSVTRLLAKLKSENITLKEYVGNQVYYGIKTGFNKAYIIDRQKKDELVALDPKNAEIIVPFVSGEEIKRFGIDSRDRYIILAKIGVELSKYPVIFDHFLKYKEQLEKRADQGEKWYELRPCLYYDIFDKPKVMFSEVQVSPKFTFDKKGYYANKTIFSIPKNDLPLVGVLNSKLVWFLIQNYCNRVQNGYILSWKFFGRIPIPKELPKELTQPVNGILQLVESLIQLRGKQTENRIQLEKELEEKTNIVDSLVYNAYRLTQEERKLVEEAISK